MFASTLFVAVGAALAGLTNAFPIVEHPAQLMAVTATPSPRVDAREAQLLASVPTPSARLEGRKDKDDGVETIYTFTPTRSATLAERHDHTDDGVISIYTATPTRSATLAERHDHTDDGVITIYTFTPTRSATLAERHDNTNDGVETIYTFTPTRSATLAERHHHTDDGVETIYTFTPTPSATLVERHHHHTDDGVITIYTFTPTPSATLVERHHNTNDGVVTIYTFTPTPTPRVWPTPSPTDLGMTIYTYTPTLSASLSARDEKDGTLTIWTLPPTEPADPEKIEGGDGTLKIWTLPPTRTPHATLTREPRAEESPLPAGNEQAEPHALVSARMMIKPGCDIHWTDDRFCSYDEPGHHHHDKRDAEEAGMSDVPGYYHEDTFKPVCWPEGNGPKPQEYSDVADCGVLSDSGQVEPSVSQVNQKLAAGGHRVICSEEGDSSANAPRCEELQGAVDGAGRLATGFSDDEKEGFRVHVGADKGHGPIIMKIILTFVLAGQGLVQLSTAASIAVGKNVLEERQIFVDGKEVPLEMAPGPVLPLSDMPVIAQSSTTGTSTTTGPSSATDRTEPAPENTTATPQEVKTGSPESSVSPTSMPAPQQMSPSPAPESKPVGDAVNTTALPHGQHLSEALQELIDGIDREKARERHDLPPLVPSKDTAKGAQPPATTLETVAAPSSSA
ncbi:hypothetical protein KC320_g850 [Hortaea werneckii]|nr:hypothetical protein KC320_g850 [Hortaea werneckii]